MENVNGFGHCFKCQSKQEILNPREKRSANDRLMMQGECSICSTKITRFIKDPNKPVKEKKEKKEKGETKQKKEKKEKKSESDLNIEGNEIFNEIVNITNEITENTKPQRRKGKEKKEVSTSKVDKEKVIGKVSKEKVKTITSKKEGKSKHLDTEKKGKVIGKKKGKEPVKTELSNDSDNSDNSHEKFVNSDYENSDFSD